MEINLLIGSAVSAARLQFSYALAKPIFVTAAIESLILRKFTHVKALVNVIWVQAWKTIHPTAKKKKTNMHSVATCVALSQ